MPLAEVMTKTRLTLPPALPRGGTLGVVAPASPVPRETFERGLQAVEDQGFRVVLGEHLFDRYGHLAGRDEDRAADLHRMFLRKDVDAILCARGGSGSIRLLRCATSRRLPRRCSASLRSPVETST